MSREFKFKNWNSEVKYMTDPYELRDATLFPMPDRISFDDIIILQFTGLKDKNGREIYEGDIILCHKGKYKIVWDIEDGGFSAISSSLSGAMINSGWLTIGGAEVIGNIYQNLELL